MRAYQTDETNQIAPFECAYLPMMVLYDVTLWDYWPDLLTLLGMMLITLAGVFVRLTKLRNAKTRSFLYTYDMGDNWEHRIDVLELFEAGRDALLPRFVAGQWRRPPEDVGGTPGFEAFLEAMADLGHPDHVEILDWHGGPFDPETIEENVVRIQFDRLARARVRRRKQPCLVA